MKKVTVNEREHWHNGTEERCPPQDLGKEGPPPEISPVRHWTLMAAKGK